jgi:hypothetical protein
MTISDKLSSISNKIKSKQQQNLNQLTSTASSSSTKSTTTISSASSSTSSSSNIDNQGSFENDNNIHHQQQLDFESIIRIDNGRKLFSQFLKEYNNSDNLLTLYLICCCFHKRIDDRQKIKQILDLTYNACFVKNQLSHLSFDLRQKLGESLQKQTYNEPVFNAVKSELKSLLEKDYFPQFIKSTLFQESPFYHSTNLSQSNSHKQSCLPINKTDVSTNINNKNGQFVVPASLANNETNRLKHSKSTSSSTSTSSTSSKLQQQSRRRNDHSNTSSRSINLNQLDEKSKRNSISSSTTTATTAAPTTTTTRSRYSFSNIAMPPNPYHVLNSNNTKTNTSAQDSEVQSVVSLDEVALAKNRKRTTANAQYLSTSIRKKELSNGNLSNVSYKSTMSTKSHHHSHHKTNANSKLDKKIKDNILANKEAAKVLNMAEEQLLLNDKLTLNNVPLIDDENTEKSKIKVKGINVHDSNKTRPKPPLSETNPKQFYELVSSKLESWLLKQQQVNNVNEYEEVEYFNESQLIVEDRQKMNNKPRFITSYITNDSLNKNTNIDDHLEKHCDRVYNSSQQQQRTNSDKSPKMCIIKANKNINSFQNNDKKMMKMNLSLTNKLKGFFLNFLSFY